MKLGKEGTIILKKVENGYILQTFYWEDTEKGRKIYREEVEAIENNESGTEDDREAFSRVIHKLAEWAGFHYNKFGKENLRIAWDKKGHKVE